MLVFRINADSVIVGFNFAFFVVGVHVGDVFEIWRHPGAAKGTPEAPRSSPGTKKEIP